MIPSVYINLEDDVARIVARIKKTRESQLVLVCPRRCQLFSDSINLRLLKKQAELLKKEVSILTMDERGQIFAKEAGFALKYLPKSRAPLSNVSDIQIQPKAFSEGGSMEERGAFSKTVEHLGRLVSGIVSKKQPDEEKIEMEAETIYEDPSFRPEKSRNVPSKAPRVQVAKKPREQADKRMLEDENFPADAVIAKKKTYGRILSLVLALALIVVLVLAFVLLPSAEVVIYAKSEPVTRDFNVSLDASLKEIDASRLVIPAAKVEESPAIKSKFKSQGKKDVGNKATGSIMIYNFTGQILNLKAETTTLTGGTMNYKLSEDALQIKPAKYKNPRTKEIDPASIGGPFEVIASMGGEGSNLPAGVRLEITNQVFGSRPQVLYAKTETPINGGTSRFLSVVSKSDIASAQTDLGKQALEQVQTKLSGQGLRLADNSYRMEPLEFTANVPEGTETPSFEATLKVKITGLAFSEKDLKNLVIERISRTLSQNRFLKTQNDFNLDYQVRNLDLNLPNGNLAVHFEGKAVNRINLDELPAKLTGKNRTEANEVLQSMTEVERVEMTLNPAWQTNFPWFSKKIQIKVIE